MHLSFYNSFNKALIKVVVYSWWSSEHPCLHQVFQLSQQSESHVISVFIWQYFSFCGKWKSQLLGSSLWVDWQTNQCDIDHFLRCFYLFIFFRQLLLIGGVDPVEDIQKFKLDGWGLLLQKSDVSSCVKLKTQFWGILKKKLLDSTPYHTMHIPPHPTMKVMLQPTV